MVFAFSRTLSWLRLAVGLCLLVGLTGSCQAQKATPLLTRNQRVLDQAPIAKPAKTSDMKYGEVFNANTVERLRKIANPVFYLDILGQWLGGNGGSDAINANAYDEVGNSSWFENRHARTRLSYEELFLGPTKVRMASDGSLTVIQGKASGVTPGFIVRDKNHEHFLLKFDPPSACGLPSGAEVISSRIFHASGFHVAENNIEWIHPERFVLDPSASERDSYGQKVSIGPSRFAELVKSTQTCMKEGRVRALASRFLPGKILGPFSFHGTRSDDPNDRIPHEDRRELRGVTVLASWINHTDLRNYNTLDTFHELGGGRGYVQHHFIDFGATLGSGSVAPKSNPAGNEYYLDFEYSGKRLMGLGFYLADWEEDSKQEFKSVGNFRSEFFHPQKWRPTHPNRALDKRTLRDAFWGAKLVASFSNEDLRSIVRAAQLPEDGAEEAMVGILARRRDRISKYWFSRVGAMDEVRMDPSLPLSLSFLDWSRIGRENLMKEYAYRILGRGLSLYGKTRENRIPIFATENDFLKWKGKVKRKSDRSLFVTIEPLALRADGGESFPVGPKTRFQLYLHEDKLYWIGTERFTSREEGSLHEERLHRAFLP